MTAIDAAPERAALADEMLLADEFIEGSRPHPGRERLAFRRRLEEGLGPGSAGSCDRTSTGHGPMVAAGLSPWRRSEREQVEDVHQHVEHGEDQQQSAANDRDPADVAADVGVLLGRPDRERD
jgi:hypothetical protein